MPSFTIVVSQLMNYQPDLLLHIFPSPNPSAKLRITLWYKLLADNPMMGWQRDLKIPAILPESPNITTSGKISFHQPIHHNSDRRFLRCYEEVKIKREAHTRAQDILGLPQFGLCPQKSQVRSLPSWKIVEKYNGCRYPRYLHPPITHSYNKCSLNLISFPALSSSHDMRTINLASN